MFARVLIVLLSFMLFACTKSTAPKSASISNDITIYYIHRDGCPGCIYMDQVLKTPEIKEILENGYKVIVLDVNEQDALPTSLEKTRTTPTFYFVDSSNRKIAKDEHVLTPKQFKQKLLEIKR